MANGIRTSDPHGFNKGRCLKFCVGSQVRQTPEEGQRTYWSKRCGNNNKDEDNSLKTLYDKKKNHHALSQKFRQLIKKRKLEFFIKSKIFFLGQMFSFYSINVIIYCNYHVNIHIVKSFFFFFFFFFPVDWGCRIHWLHLCWEVRLPKWVFWIWH